MAFAVLTVGADGNIYIYIYIFQIFIVWLCLLRDYGFIPSCVERLYVVVLQSHLQNLIEVQDGFDCVANLEILKDHPLDFPCHEKAIVFVVQLLLHRGLFC